MMLVLSLLIVSTLVLSFYSVDELTQMLSGAGLVYMVAAVVALLVLRLILKRRRAAAQAQQGGAPR